MFELTKYSKASHAAPVTPTAPYDHVSDISHMSLLLWTEHCVECAAPACYETCDLFDDRGDGHCRRFRYGVYRNARFTSVRGYGAEVSFKKWAKLESVGNMSVQPVKTVLRQERVVRRLSPLLEASGKLAFRMFGRHRFSRVTQALMARVLRRRHAAHRNGWSPTSFLLEAYNPSDETCLVQIAMSIEAGANRPGGLTHVDRIPPFLRSVSLPAGYSRHEIEAERFRAIADSGKPFLVSLIPASDSAATLVLLTADFVVRSGATADNRGRKIKCVVWDLDNTVWDGVLAEGDDVRLRDDVAAMLRRLDERGILLSIASRNEYAPAWSKVEAFGLADYFLRPQIHWGAKSQSLKDIAEALNFGLDTIAFIDDSEFELDQVRHALPDVTCIRADRCAGLLNDVRFQGGASEEARARRRYYKDEIARERERIDSGLSYEAFLAGCGIVLDIGVYQPEDFDRVSELVQRTNQLNFSGRHYSRQELAAIVADVRREKYVLRCQDNYGSYGMVGFCIARRGEREIIVEDFMLSCRVQSKQIERAFFNGLRETCPSELPVTLRVTFRQTSRNGPARQVLESLGFAERGRERELVLDGSRSLACPFIDMRWRSRVEVG